jgi:hypothetical protein
VLVLADRDALNLDRRLPVDRDLLQTAADLLGGILHTGRLIEELGDTSRTLGAVTRLGTSCCNRERRRSKRYARPLPR